MQPGLMFFEAPRASPFLLRHSVGGYGARCWRPGPVLKRECVRALGVGQSSSVLEVGWRICGPRVIHRPKAHSPLPFCLERLID
ncbi:unnamed protein product [Amoebophrya sp. A120]|nr:unnamed protein product [Amoebophrya sp. A120]|eukprot:GSA120T00017820001.1